MSLALFELPRQGLEVYRHQQWVLPWPFPARASVPPSQAHHGAARTTPLILAGLRDGSTSSVQSPRFGLN